MIWTFSFPSLHQLSVNQIARIQSWVLKNSTTHISLKVNTTGTYLRIISVMTIFRKKFLQYICFWGDMTIVNLFLNSGKLFIHSIHGSILDKLKQLIKTKYFPLNNKRISTNIKKPTPPFFPFFIWVLIKNICTPNQIITHINFLKRLQGKRTWKLS